VVHNHVCVRLSRDPNKFVTGGEPTSWSQEQTLAKAVSGARFVSGVHFLLATATVCGRGLAVDENEKSRPESLA
jgi:hypothetical protein